PLQGRLDRDAAEVVGRQIAKSPVEGAHRGARRRDDDDVVLHYQAPVLRGGRNGRSISRPKIRWLWASLTYPLACCILDSPPDPVIVNGTLTQIICASACR